MRTLGLRGRVILGFAAGALLLSTMLTLVTDVVSARYLVDQRERAASRQAVVNGLFVESRLTKDGAVDPAGALGAIRLGTGADAILLGPGDAASTAIGLSEDDLPPELVTVTEGGQPSSQIYRADGALLIAVGVPLSGGYSYFEITELDNLEDTPSDDHLGGCGGCPADVLAGRRTRLVGCEPRAASDQRCGTRRSQAGQRRPGGPGSDYDGPRPDGHLELVQRYGRDVGSTDSA